MMSADHWNTILTALTTVDGLPPDATGIVTFGADAGGMLVENGRVCWVVAAGLQRRLTDLLTEQASLQGMDLDDVYARARSAHKPVGQFLVQDGVLPPETLDGVLRRHSAESLAVLASSTSDLAWRPRTAGGYLPRFTYRADDVLLDVVKLELADHHARAAAELARYAGPGIAGAAFLRARGLAFPVPLARVGHDGGLEPLVALGRRAMRLCRAACELEDDPQYVMSTTASGETSCVWWSEDVVFAMTAGERTAIARVTAQFFAERRA